MTELQRREEKRGVNRGAEQGRAGESEQRILRTGRGSVDPVLFFRLSRSGTEAGVGLGNTAGRGRQSSQQHTTG